MQVLVFCCMELLRGLAGIFKSSKHDKFHKTCCQLNRAVVIRSRVDMSVTRPSTVHNKT